MRRVQFIYLQIDEFAEQNGTQPLAANRPLPEHFFKSHLPRKGWTIRGAEHIHRIQGTAIRVLKECLKGLREGTVYFAPSETEPTPSSSAQGIPSAEAQTSSSELNE